MLLSYVVPVYAASAIIDKTDMLNADEFTADISDCLPNSASPELNWLIAWYPVMLLSETTSEMSLASLQPSTARGSRLKIG